MKYSRLFGKTLRTTPQGFKARSHALLLQGGFVRSLGQGLFSLLPLGVRVTEKIKNLIREEMESLGGQEVQVPLINPEEIWIKTGRSFLKP